jgi:tetratricopeptide (TPR) repeat protein
MADISPVQTEVLRLRRLQSEGRHEDALAAARAMLVDWPRNRDLLLLQASSLRHLLRIDEAMESLARLETLQPRFSLLHQERGLCFVARRDAPLAIDALLRAVNINPALPMAWKMLEGLYRLIGDADNSATAAAHVGTLASLPGEVVACTALFADGDLDPAEQRIRAFLLRHGDHPEAMRLLAKIGMARGVLDDAELLLAAMLKLEPNHRAARLEYARCLVDRHRYAAAREQLEQLLAFDPANLDYRALAAAAAVGLGRHAEAITIYQSILAEAPDAADPYMWLGHALKTVGRTAEAVPAYRSAAGLRADFGDAWWSLANLKTYRFEDQEIARMRAAEAGEQVIADDRAHLCFALGKALEDRGQFEESWVFYARGNALKRSESLYRSEILETNTRLQKAVCTPAFFARRTGWGDPRPDPIFVVGLPRSGSTLIEQILASHAQVDGTQELADVQAIVGELQGRDHDLDNPPYPGVLARLEAEDVARLGARYLADTAIHRAGRPFFIDKMPNNFRHIGLIHLMLPRATVIDARREPMSCCFSILKQLFARGQEFAYSVEDVARYYRTYLELMAHWDEALPGKVLRVRHEDVVEDLETQVRRILDHCQLPFDPACVAFHRNRRSVRTPSSEQVRQPIFRDGLDAWRPYEPWLGPLRDALGDAVERYRDGTDDES